MRTMLWILGFLLSGAASALPEERARVWSDDLAWYLETGEEHHLDLYHSADPESVRSAVNALVAELPSLNEQQVLVRFLAIARMFGDGHTAVQVLRDESPRLPLRFFDYRYDHQGSVRVLAVLPGHEHLLGHELLAVDGHPVGDVLARLRPVVQYVENEHSIAVRSRQYLTYLDVLYGLDIGESPDSVRLRTRDAGGREHVTQVDAIAARDYSGQDERTVWPESDTGPFRRVLAASDTLWLGETEGGRVAYLQFADYPRFEDMMGFTARLEAHLASASYRHLIIDLRDNGGGDFFVGLVLATALLPVDSLDWSEGIHVLIGGKVFSASMSNATHYRQILNARLYGSPTGAVPIGYQETHNARLPGIGLPVTFSKRYYRFQDRQTDGVLPDVPVVGDWDSFRQGRDAVLERVLQETGR